MHVAEGEGAALSLAGIEGGAADEPRLDQLAARDAHRRERAVAERGAREIRTADGRRLETTVLEAALREIEIERVMKWSTSAGISSLRSRKGGTITGKTLSL
jgi:hypothetical protein